MLKSVFFSVLGILVVVQDGKKHIRLYFHRMLGFLKRFLKRFHSVIGILQVCLECHLLFLFGSVRLHLFFLRLSCIDYPIGKRIMNE